MYIVQIASECAPVIKAGGLGDVVFGLSRELEKRGHAVEIVLPKYDCMRYDHIWGMHEAYKDLVVPWYGAAIYCDVYCGWVYGRLCFFIDPHSDDLFFNRGCYYGCDDDPMRFAFFSKAALEFLLRTNKRPDIIHCHDWQTGLIPVLLFEVYKYHGMEDQRICYTIHNFKHQGISGTDILWATGLNREAYYFASDRLADPFNPFALNLMKGGIVYSNFVTTVSPHHAWEAHYGDCGYGLGHTIHEHQHKFGGVLNGIDSEVWNPALDRYIPHHFDADTFEDKAKNKKALRERLWLAHGDKPLVEYLPLYKGKKGEVVTQFDMKKVEDIGLVKFDFLGLRNLTVIDHALKSIVDQGKSAPDLANLPMDDEKTFTLLQSGDTTGVFQLESSGMKNLMVRLHPESFEDLTALVALYRPGPLDSGMVDDFVDRKHGKKEVVYSVDSLEPILQETYGVIVYQEQVMQVAGALAGYTMADADSLRKAIGKKIADLMAKHREKFVAGAVKNGVDKAVATELFDLIEKFGGYGFNKSHSAAYALIAYQTAYLKAHFPVEFMAALLTSEIDTIDGVVKFINECRAHDIEVLPPDINESSTLFTAVDDRIRFGLAAVKNVGGAAVDLIIAEREANGPFASLFDFCQRVDLTKVNKRVLESLIRCGALDSTGVYRSRLMAVLEEALDRIKRSMAAL